MKDFPEDFDPNLVPRWPRLTLEITGSGQPTIYKGQLGGRPIPMPDSVDTADPYEVIEASIQHASGLIAERGWETCRVSAVDPDGHVWPMILGADGERYDLTDTHHSDPGRGQRHPMRTLALVMAAAVLVPALIVGGLFLGRHYATEEPVAAGPYSPRIGELPVPAPAGWTTHAAWYVGDIDTSSAAVFDEAVWVLRDGALIRLNPTTGEQLGSWQVGSSAQGPWLTRVDGRPVVAVATPSAVMWLDSPHADQLVRHTIPTGSTVTATVDGLWWVHGQDAWVGSQQPQRRTVPADATIAAAEGTALIATDRLGRLWRLESDSVQTPTPLQLQAPTPSARFDRVLAVGSKSVAASWRTSDGQQGTQVAFYSTTGAPVVVVTTHANVTGQTRLDPQDPSRVIFGQVIADLRTKALTPLPQGVTLSGVVDGLGFGRRDSESVTIDLTTGKVKHRSPTISQPATPVGVVGERLLVVDQGSIFCLDSA